MNAEARLTTTSFFNMIGNVLADYTKAHSHVGYRMGARTTAGGCVDCSGWAAQTIQAVAAHANDYYGHDLYHGKDLTLLNAAAASQIQNVGQKTGFIKEDHIFQGKITSGTLIGIRRQNGGAWAAQRWMQISHVVIFLDDGKQAYVSQSASDKGVHLIPFDQWLGRERELSSDFFAANPFKMIQQKAPDHIKRTITGGPIAGDGLTLNDSFAAARIIVNGRSCAAPQELRITHVAPERNDGDFSVECHVVVGSDDCFVGQRVLIPARQAQKLYVDKNLSSLSRR